MAPSFAALALATLPVAASFRANAQQTHVYSMEHNSSWPSSRAELPACPCTIYSGFCSQWDLGHGGEDWGVACVASENAIITMGWMVQCVPVWKGHLTYPCPRSLPVKCDAGRTQDPCDTSALGRCEADTCTAGAKLKSPQHVPIFCHLGQCTQTECCESCLEGATSVGGQCMGAGGVLPLPDTCCQTPPPDSYREQLCDEQLRAIAEQTLKRMDAYATICYSGGSNPRNMNAPGFALTPAGARKLCEAPCQSSAVLQDAPADVLGDAIKLATQCADSVLVGPAFRSQTGVMGLFAAAGEMDSKWKACSEAGVPEGDEGGGFISKDDLFER